MSHLRVLRDGIDRWNVWRKDKPDTKPILHGVNLRGQMLRGANLRGADLSGADLRDASFRRADLSLSNLNGAILNRTIFSGTNLRGVSIRNARLYETVFANADLSNALGLDECAHRGPSVIDHRTLARSGKLPLAFLLGCGLRDEAIKLTESSSMPSYYSCFISYSSVDQEFAEKLFADLQRSGVRCWFAPEEIKIGEKLRTSIDNGIRSREKLLLILSSSSIASPWVEKEVEAAFEEEAMRREPILFPIRVDDAPLSVTQGWPADIRRTRQIGDFRNWADNSIYSVSFGRLIRDLSVDTSIQVGP